MRACRLVRGVAGAVLLVVAAGSMGCASGAGRPASGGAAARGTGAPWEIPPSAFPSQRLFQGAYDGPEGGGSFRATLRLAAPDRFRLDAADRLGRLLWSVGVDGAGAWWVDHHAGTWCPDLSRLALPGLGLGPVPPSSLPALLLGLLPAQPAGSAPPVLGAGVPEAAGEVALEDAAGRHWSAILRAGRVDSWTVSEGDQPLWWWLRQGRGGILSQRQGRQLRWQEVVVEPLRGELPPRAVPAGYAEACDERPPA